jgi:phosphoribosylaminoimidazolecarboxamide formyltransferase/IMP cyclohydrolase
MTPIRTALLSVYDKTGLEDFARFLAQQQIEIISTGGTLQFLRERDIPVTSVSDYTGQAEILGGRVKTLHPKIFAGILARRNVPADMQTLSDSAIKPIDVVCVNLYPFEETVSRPGTTVEQAIEQIDIGGVSLIRAAAKNHPFVLVAASPFMYPLLHKIIENENCKQSEADIQIRRILAARAFVQTFVYDRAIERYLDGLTSDLKGEAASLSLDLPGREPQDLLSFPACLDATFEKVQDLRYGENPHQQAAFYRVPGLRETCVANARQIHGKELSYNNIVDLDSALEVVRSFEEPTCCIIKHNNPCGVARAETLSAAFTAARECDPVSAFGSVIGFNREVDEDTAQKAAEMFVEAVIAPGFSTGARDLFQKKKNIRLLECGSFTPPGEQAMLKSVVGGVLVQNRDRGMVTRDQLKVVSQLKPDEADLDALLFAWRVAKFVKSNAIVYTSRDATIGIGAGQMSRIDSTNIGAVKARSPIRGFYMASDAFFPFRDNIDRAADIGIRAIIEPGGSVRDDEVIAAADEHKLILVFTGMRHFRH